MAFFAPFARSFSKATKPSQAELENYLQTEDLEHSFASTMSLNSPPHSPNMPTGQLLPPGGYAHGHSPMDISPCPPSKAYLGVPGSGRHFGREIVNSLSPSPMLPGDATRSSGRGRQRSALPSQWLQPSPECKPKASTASTLVDCSPSFKDSDAMDVDSPRPAMHSEHKLLDAAPILAPLGNDLGSLFFESMSPAPKPSKKRRSLSPDAIHDASSSPAASSPITRKFDRFASTGHNGLLFKKASFTGAAPAVTNGNKRRRPVLSALIPANDGDIVQSSYPMLETAKPEVSAPKSKAPAPPVRRAFSALVAPAPMFGADLSSDDTSADIENSSPAGAYARRQESRLVRKVDGTADFRPLHGAGALNQLDRDQVKDNVALPEFGDIEADGKILPCTRVKQDGLMRITAKTLGDLLDGRYDEKLNSFVVVDCRFDYEYSGGHIPGAINISSRETLDELLLGKNMPASPSRSGDGTAKNVLVFHCELSEHRAPTLAKYLRSRDRAINTANYPKICYPELYILQGGYKEWFSCFPNRCEPRGYVIMDDAKHKDACETQLDQLRKFGRHRSYTYGDRGTGALPRPPQRTSAPAGTLNFTAATTRPRRGTLSSGLDTLHEGGDTSHSGDDGPNYGDSPCPPPSKTAALRATKGRIGIERAVTFRAF